jgi:YD repeat-containing protein
MRAVAPCVCVCVCSMLAQLVIGIPVSMAETPVSRLTVPPDARTFTNPQCPRTDSTCSRNASPGFELIRRFRVSDTVHIGVGAYSGELTLWASFQRQMALQDPTAGFGYSSVLADWDLTTNQRLVRVEGNLLWRHRVGAHVEFQRRGSRWVDRNFQFRAQSYGNGETVIRSVAGTEWRFVDDELSGIKHSDGSEIVIAAGRIDASRTRYPDVWSVRGVLGGLDVRSGRFPTKAWSLRRDDHSRVRTMVDPLGHTYGLTYDQAGLLSVLHDPLGALYEFTYEDGRLVDLRSPYASASWERNSGVVDEQYGDARRRLRFDSSGLLIEDVSSIGVSRFGRDDKGWIVDRVIADGRRKSARMTHGLDESRLVPMYPATGWSAGTPLSTWSRHPGRYDVLGRPIDWGETFGPLGSLHPRMGEDRDPGPPSCVVLHATVRGQDTVPPDKGTDGCLPTYGPPNEPVCVGGPAVKSWGSTDPVRRPTQGRYIGGAFHWSSFRWGLHWYVADCWDNSGETARTTFVAQLTPYMCVDDASMSLTAEHTFTAGDRTLAVWGSGERYTGVYPGCNNDHTMTLEVAYEDVNSCRRDYYMDYTAAWRGEDAVYYETYGYPAGDRNGLHVALPSM